MMEIVLMLGIAVWGFVAITKASHTSSSIDEALLDISRRLDRLELAERLDRARQQQDRGGDG